MAEQRHRVVVVGGGFGGLNATRALADAPVDVTIIDKTSNHLFQPLLYEVATGILSGGLIAPPLRHVLRRQRNAHPMLGEVTTMDLEARRVTAVTPEGNRVEVPYDTLIVAAGAAHAYFGRDDWEMYAPGMKTLEDAWRLRSHIYGAFEMAELATDPDVREAWLTFVIVGAGPTGVELTGQVAELAHRVLPQEYRSIDTRTTKIILIDAAPAVLPPFAKKLQRYTQRTLEKMGVDVRPNTLAVDMDDEGITVRGPDGEQRIAARTKIWAAGVQASPLAEMLAKATGAELDRAGRVAVQPDCTLPGHPEVFAIGDMVSLNGLPGVAQPAIQEGKYVGKVIKARVTGQRPPEPFKYLDKGSMATIGRQRAVADAFGVRLTGFLAWTVWAFIHVLYLIGWGNRFGTMVRWTRALFTLNRGERLITLQQAHDEITHDQTDQVPRKVLGVGRNPSLSTAKPNSGSPRTGVGT